MLLNKETKPNQTKQKSISYIDFWNYFSHRLSAFLKKIYFHLRYVSDFKSIFVTLCLWPTFSYFDS